MAKPTIVYIGNQLLKHGLSPTSIDILGEQLGEYANVIRASSKLNQGARLFHMISTVLSNTKAKFVLIDTYSTKNIYFAVVIGFVCRIVGLKYVGILRGGRLLERLNQKSKIIQDYFKHAYKLVAPSDFLAIPFNEAGYPVEVIPNNLPIKNYEYKKREGIKPNILWVRSFNELYNPLLAVNLIDELKDDLPEVQLCMVGGEKDGTMQICKEVSRKLGLNDRVTFTGKLPKPEWLTLSKEYDIFLNSTNVDNTPVSVMEAMALGMIVVSTNVGGIPYILHDNVEGKLVPPRDVEALKKAVLDLLRDSAKCKEMSLAARARAEKWDWHVVKEKWKKLIENA